MAAFDYCGPKTREVIRNSPMEVVVGQMLAAMPVELYADDPATMDSNVAIWLRAMIRERYKQPADYFVLKRKPPTWPRR